MYNYILGLNIIVGCYKQMGLDIFYMRYKYKYNNMNGHHHISAGGLSHDFQVSHELSAKYWERVDVLVDWLMC